MSTPQTPGARAAICVHQFAKAFGLETTPLERAAHYSEVYDFGSGCVCCSPDGDLVRVRNAATDDDGVLAKEAFELRLTARDPGPHLDLAVVGTRRRLPRAQRHVQRVAAAPHLVELVRRVRRDEHRGAVPVELPDLVEDVHCERAQANHEPSTT